MATVLGVNARSYPSELHGSIHFRVVMLEDQSDGKRTVVVGDGPVDWVANYGFKLSFEDARLHFPNVGLEKDKYKQ